MILGNVRKYGERINIEYKEFCFKTNLFDVYKKKDLRVMIQSGKVLNDFNDLIKKNIKKYIQSYVPRYASSFHNCKLNNEYKLYIGINDYNEVTGIPYNGNLKKYNSHLQDHVNYILNSRVDDKCCVSVSCEIKEVLIDEDILDDEYLESILGSYEEKKEQYDKEYSKYIIDKRKWILDIYKYKGKLQEVINNDEIKLEFVKYLEEKNLLKCFKEVFLKNHEIPSDSIKYVKKSPTEMVHWLIKFKDEKVKSLLDVKPKEPFIPKILNIEYCLLTKLSCLRKRFVKNGVRYYTILLRFKCCKNCKNIVSFKDEKTNQFRRIKRYMCSLKKTPQSYDF
jgi:hypothetical protein